MPEKIECLFFDAGLTLVDESCANEHRLRDAIRIRQGFGGMAENLTETETPDFSVCDPRELAELLR